MALAATGSFYKLRNSKALGVSIAETARPTTAVVGYTNILFAITAAGDIGPADQVSVRPEINGLIQDLPVDIGDKVKKDSILFTLNDKELQTEKKSRLAEIAGAQLQLERSERNYKRSQLLFTEKLVSQELFDDSKTDFELAKNALERAQTVLHQLEEQLTKTKILAPFDCTVLTRPVSVGQAVSGSGGFNSGTEVMTIANLNDMIINTHINQADITRLKVSQEVAIEVEAVPGMKLKGVIERLAPQATVRNGIKGFATRIALKELDTRVRPGMTANLSIPVAAADNVLTVPLSAVFTEETERFVLVKKEDGTLDKRPVTIGVADFFLVEIQSGLKPGEVVLIEPPANLESELAAASKPGDAKGIGRPLGSLGLAGTSAAPLAPKTNLASIAKSPASTNRPATTPAAR
jgi:RND family efflux transporter MFP subunit